MMFVYIFVACGLISVLLSWWAGIYKVLRGAENSFWMILTTMAFDFFFWWVQLLYHLLYLVHMAGDAVMYRLWR